MILKTSENKVYIQQEEWEWVFLITAAVYALGGVLYGLLASGERQPWSKIDYDLDNTDTETIAVTTNNEPTYGGIAKD